MRRGVFPADELWAIGGANGARALGLEAWGEVEIDTGHPSLHGVEPQHLRAALVSGCSADVVARS